MPSPRGLLGSMQRARLDPFLPPSMSAHSPATPLALSNSWAATHARIPHTSSPHHSTLASHLPRLEPRGGRVPLSPITPHSNPRAQRFEPTRAGYSNFERTGGRRTGDERTDGDTHTHTHARTPTHPHTPSPPPPLPSPPPIPPPARPLSSPLRGLTAVRRVSGDLRRVGKRPSFSPRQAYGPK